MPEPLPELMKQFVERQRSPATQRAYEVDLRDFFSGGPTENEQETLLMLGENDLRRRLSNYETHLRTRRLKENTIERRLNTLRAFHSWAASQRGLDSFFTNAPRDEEKTKNARSPKTASRSGSLGKAGPKRTSRIRAEQGTQAPSQEKVQCLLQAPDTSTLRGSRDAAILHLLCDSGLLRAEVCALNWSDFRLQEQVLIVPVKGSREELEAVPLLPATVEALHLYGQQLRASPSVETAPGAPFFRSAPRGQWTRSDLLAAERLTIDGIYYLVGFYGSACGLPQLSSRQLRHGAILAVLEEAGRDVAKAHVRLPHITLGTLVRYRALTPPR